MPYNQPLAGETAKLQPVHTNLRMRHGFWAWKKGKCEINELRSKGICEILGFVFFLNKLSKYELRSHWQQKLGPDYLHNPIFNREILTASTAIGNRLFSLRTRTMSTARNVNGSIRQTNSRSMLATAGLNCYFVNTDW